MYIVIVHVYGEYKEVSKCKTKDRGVVTPQSRPSFEH